MIQIVDEITLAPERIPDVLALLRDRYLPGHAARGLTAAGRWVSPPVAVPGQPSTLWLTWHVDDAPSYYRMRALTDGDVVAFWMAVDGLCDARRRHVMTDADAPLPALKEAGHAA
ncbi:hypothetical protein BBJ41_21220 [Burkholderia stabilis]|uniref:Uncharacterized protein n=1 Tax=Burkholderia stabilis TaxID=95485 RepID=A0AAJ5NES9_9BURK|nr:hypothetical protein [Burkholderia stabilis]AOR70103.1 hypothetical protein BBJ41_21220 [Burkholderia stabilis]VBB14035.1 hypothetical protein BSTAB16_4221 [Burkholderia stabilis]HDR9489268.1 hypothetical protein [Burkholderia stabilis]HDR9522102.1 hypothetical protein [Burkholderia stabilis]HDR9529161.1 hypothetical protein [Burkholderia stabilis]